MVVLGTLQLFKTLENTLKYFACKTMQKMILEVLICLTEQKCETRKSSCMNVGGTHTTRGLPSLGGTPGPVRVGTPSAVQVDRGCPWSYNGVPPSPAIVGNVAMYYGKPPPMNRQTGVTWWNNPPLYPDTGPFLTLQTYPTLQL